TTTSSGTAASSTAATATPAADNHSRWRIYLPRGDDPPGDPPKHRGVPPPLPPRRSKPRDGTCGAEYVFGGCRTRSAVIPPWCCPSIFTSVPASSQSQRSKRKPTPRTVVMYLGWCASSPSLRRSQEMCMSSVLVDVHHLASHTSRMICSLVTTLPASRSR